MRISFTILGLLFAFVLTAQPTDIKSMQLRENSKVTTVKYRDVHHRQVQQKVVAHAVRKQVMLQQKDFNDISIRPNSKDYKPRYRGPLNTRPVRMHAIDNTQRLSIHTNADFQRKQQLVKKRNRAIMQKHMHDKQLFQSRRRTQQKMIRRKMMQQQMQQRRNVQRKSFGR